MRTIQDMIQSEVLCCMSHIVSTLAQGIGGKTPNNELDGMIEQAFELACPIPDYEEAAFQEGWKVLGGREFRNGTEYGSFRGWQELCEDEGYDPIDREVFEHWAVTDWFADKLIAAGEKVDKDFGNLCIWARTTTGQAIYADGVIERIYAATHQKEEA